MNFHVVCGWIFACLMIASLPVGKANCQEGSQLASHQPFSTTPCADGCATCGGVNSHPMDYQVPEIRYGANLGFPQFGQVTHGVWYNGPRFGPGQNRSARPAKCNCKSCKMRRANTIPKKSKRSQFNGMNIFTGIFAEAGWELEQTVSQNPEPDTNVGNKMKRTVADPNSVSAKPMPGPDTFSFAPNDRTSGRRHSKSIAVPTGWQSR